MTRPIVRNNIDWDEVIQLTEQHLDEVEDGESEDSDTVHLIFEAVLTAVYGTGVHSWESSNHE
jgi:hypothetical protein